MLRSAARLRTISSRRAAYATAKTSGEIRRAFVDYFEREHGHVHVPSSKLVPHNDKSLLFTNAGMVQFKDYFLNPSRAPFKKAVSVQRCMRAGGKHNDLDNVGYTPRHHTLFEMLGNFSFGEVSKQDAIQHAWTFLTDRMGLPRDRLRVTVLNTDQEAAEIWKRNHGVITVPCGPEDNFWSMGDGAGPCGPCSEIYWDRYPGDETNTPDDARYLEIWNLVFMQLSRQSDGSLVKLPSPCIDTGMGLERLASVLQNTPTNFEIDTFHTIMTGLQEISRSRNGKDLDFQRPQVRIIADHIRAAAFLISDGVLPSNSGRGYVLRRIIRRMIKAERDIFSQTGLLADVLAFVAKAHPEQQELTAELPTIAAILAQEEKMFSLAYDRGVQRMEHFFVQTSQQKKLSGQQVFELYDSYGFPMDLTEMLAKERGWMADIQESEKLLENQREIGRQSWQGGNSAEPASLDAALKSLAAEAPECRRTVYETSADHPTLCRIVTSQEVFAPSSPNDERVWLLALDPCPFYPGGGGQVPDDVELVAPGCPTSLPVSRVHMPKEDRVFVEARIRRDNALSNDWAERLEAGGLIRAQINISSRNRTAAHHSATHLLHRGLKSVLGEGVVQAGSLVDKHRLRFDFTHTKPLTFAEIAAVEKLINAWIDMDLPISTKELKYADACASGAVGIFEEKYGEVVRVVSIGDVSREMCGGTHASRTSMLRPFKIVSEGSVASGTRRIEAVAGIAAIEHLMKQSEVLQQVCQALQCTAEEIGTRLAKMNDRTRALGKQLEEVKDKLAAVEVRLLSHSPANNSTSGHPVTGDHLIAVPLDNGVAVYVRLLEEDQQQQQQHQQQGKADAAASSKESHDQLRKRALAIRAAFPQSIHALISARDGRIVCVAPPPQQSPPSPTVAAAAVSDKGKTNGSSTSLASPSSSSVASTGIKANHALSQLLAMAGGGRGGGSPELAEGVFASPAAHAWSVLKARKLD